MNRSAFRVALGAVLPAAALVASPALAVGPDLTGMTDAFETDTVVAAILAIGAAAMTIWLAVIGYKYVQRMLGRA